ncbi:acetate/propionate family kinase [Pseudohalocynthiibacter sp. F2068]|uniref:acetate/propionate family kinase n=1 Tax=Pseudohalocynthiibacter sp. F2068 TaxID=2926418 RepID=UPI001FF133B1|nr:acetate/propionate family kinase [Pseudohalocynthiibacter sp. F2068]
MTDVILIINCGSSSLKFAVYPANEHADEALLTGKVMGIGHQPVLTARMGGEALAVTEPLNNIPQDASHEWLIEQLLDRLHSEFVSLNPVAAGHRVVHGGSEFFGPVLTTANVRRKLEDFVPLAPLHQPHNLAAIDAIDKFAPHLPQVACFDTSFHRTQPRLGQMFALPYALTDTGIIRYGFHGLSYEYIAAQLPTELGAGADGRVIVAHLGNGASMCAMKNRQSVATTMGFTALDGLMMGRRCGSLDPGAILHLMQEKGLSVDEVQRILYRESGMLGVSGISNNMQVLEQRTEPRAKEAIDLFCYRAVREIGSLAAAIGGLDALVFTAGIGENSVVVRQKICAELGWLGVELDIAANASNQNQISAAGATVDVRVIKTDEESVIAASSREVLNSC